MSRVVKELLGGWSKMYTYRRMALGLPVHLGSIRAEGSDQEMVGVYSSGETTQTRSAPNNVQARWS